MMRAITFSMGCVAFTLGCGGVPPVETCEAIILDMPHGEWRVHVHPDGSGRYGYGALPELGRIEPETFDFVNVHTQLATRVTPDRNHTQPASGTVQFCVRGSPCGPLWYLYDPELADSLFDLAWAHRSEPTNELERRASETIDQFWSARDSLE